uniref:Uncharacterized protein n=1 Tax=Opuntia streptacantha TaxID=393608 RepID=A0A7C9D5E7_OPUST
MCCYQRQLKCLTRHTHVSDCCNRLKRTVHVPYTHPAPFLPKFKCKTDLIGITDAATQTKDSCRIHESNKGSHLSRKPTQHTTSSGRKEHSHATRNMNRKHKPQVI